MNAEKELNSVKYGSFRDIFDKMRQLSAEYGDLPAESLISAFGSVTGRWYTNNPYMQNQRVKGVSTRPANYSKDQIARMIQSPEGSEQPLRAVERALEYQAYPLFHMRTVYQNLLTYHSYVAPSLTNESDSKRDDFWREWKLLERLRKKLDIKSTAHMIAGQAIQNGKVFYIPRIRVDKSHNRVQHAFLQQLPSDYVKIVGFNNVSKYTVAFNLMYFMMPGTAPEQFGDLFYPFLRDFYSSVRVPDGLGKSVVYASIDLNKVRQAADERVEAYYQNGAWCYWVTLPVDRVFTFEIDDTDRNVLPIFSGLFIDFIQLAQMEQIQLELLQNPLVSLLHGEIPYWTDRAGGGAQDEYKLSRAGLMIFQALWAQMLSENNTSGIGLYAAPFQNMKLESLAEAPSALNIVTTGYQDTMSQAGMTAIIPASDEARAGAVQVSLAIESRMAQTIYSCFERMMSCIFDKLNLKYEWDFHMFGSLAEDEKMEKALKEQMTLGILPATIEYNALHDRSILDDIAISDAILSSELLNRRLPLVSSYHAKQEVSGLPPQSEYNPQGGRPEAESPETDGNEQDIDGGEKIV